MKYSSYQSDLFKAVKSTSSNLVVSAVAGSGKTFSLLESMKLVEGDSIFLAFSKTIANELGIKCPKHVVASTLHSVGCKAIIRKFGRIKIDNRKLSFIMSKFPATSFLEGMTGKEKAGVFKLRDQITSLISNWKNTLIDFENDEAVVKSADYYGIQFDKANLGIARSIMKKSIADKFFIDFDDMIYLPVALNLSMIQYSNVFVDECQDLNRTQIEMILKIKKTTGRIIAVGDPKQSIYGFRGADICAMDRIQESLKAELIPLSVCYRCPKSHLELAREIVPHIEAAPDAIEGNIETINDESFIEKTDSIKNGLVLCRTNAPLVGYALQLIKSGRKAHVKGADIGKYLRGIVIGSQTKSIVDFNKYVDSWENSQLEALEKRHASESVKETICDYADVLRCFSSQSKDTFDISAKIDMLFSDSATEGTIFSSCHRAKGLQNESVFILRTDLLPMIRKDQKEWELEQEMNIKYVALTRSTLNLFFVTEDE